MTDVRYRNYLDGMPLEGVYRLRGLRMTRIETFTDAAFAFALTLLVISLEPPTDVESLFAAIRQVPAFLCSAVLLMVFWWGHHEWSRRFGLDDGPTVVLSCLLVFTVLIYVVPLRFMFTLMFTRLEYLTGLPVGSLGVGLDSPRDVNTMFLVYGIGFVAMSGALTLLNLYALRVRDALGLDPTEIHETRAEAGVWAIMAASGGLSAALALLTPPTTYGLPGWVYAGLPLAIPIYAIGMNRRRPVTSDGDAATG